MFTYMVFLKIFPPFYICIIGLIERCLISDICITGLIERCLISDKTKISCLFPRGQVLSLGIGLTRLTIPRSAGSFKVEAFSSQCSVRFDFGIWVSSVSQSMSSFSMRKKVTAHVS